MLRGSWYQSGLCPPTMRSSGNYVGFGSRAVLQARPVAAKAVSRLSGAIMIIIALLLLIDQILR
ncbi:hypothetical protein PS710_04362 [Pseudomonas fluorescens]|uniref:Uncharacterized protein n=1 Tax=Pseudomonas fluorescens TaxID=294 RepID=A0A5E7E7T0_PSEFL|nr:hypothetical protein PS710_04362 [Pseudomonas fluorescens]